MESIPLGGRQVLVLGGHGVSSKDPNPLGICEVIQSFAAE
jgi:hypothetical protein